MPIHDLGYRASKTEPTAASTRWTVVADTGIRRVWQSAWIRRIILFAWLPLLVFAVLLLAYELAAKGIFQSITVPIVSSMDFADELRAARTPVEQVEAMESMRREAWLRLVRLYLRLPQGLALILLVGLIAPRLISEDVSSRAFLFYFSRPLRRFEYVLGKSATVWGFLATITLLPALFLYLMAVAFSASPAVLLATWDIPLRIIGASLVVIVPAGAISLCFSSMTRDSRYAAFAWFALWTVGIVSWTFVGFWRMSHGEAFFNPGPPRPEEHLSLHHIFGAVQSRMLGLTSTGEVKWFVMLLVFTTVVSMAILFRRVSSPMRA